MKNNRIPFYIWSVMLCILFFSFSFFSCSSDEDNVQQEAKSSFDPTRKTFATSYDFEDFFKVQDESKVFNEQSCYSPDDELNTIDMFIRYTVIGSILNKNLEYQVGDIIYKYGTSGYTIYSINASKYWDALQLISNEDKIIANITSYQKVGNDTYKLADGIQLSYNGDPIITVFLPNVPLPKIADDGKTKVQTSFWVSKSPFQSEFGVQVQAWSRNSVNEDWQNANTEIELRWNLRAKMPNIPYPQPLSGNRKGQGNKIRQRLGWNTGYFAYKMEDGVVSGSAKCWDGSWINAIVKK